MASQPTAAGEMASAIPPTTTTPAAVIAAFLRVSVPCRICCAAMSAIAATTAALATLMATSPRASP